MYISKTTLILSLLVASLFGFAILTYIGEISIVGAKLLSYITIKSVEGTGTILRKTGETLEKGSIQVQNSGVAEKIFNDNPNINNVKTEQSKDVIGDELVNKLKPSTKKSKYSDNDGFCYIGISKGVRDCARITNGEQCMSGEIFKKQELCINPELRL